MTGVLDGINVLEFAWGGAGPMTGMVLADNGAHVTTVTPPADSVLSDQADHPVWNRGKRSAVLDLKLPADRSTAHELAANCDVLIESFEPKTMQRFGLAYGDLRELNPRLVYCSISGYGGVHAHQGRRAYDALVAARTGLQWESRGTVGGTMARLAGSPVIMPGYEPPDGYLVATRRPGPLFSALPWPTLAAFYLATLGISSALRAREITGRGQHVSTSLLQGALLNGVSPWQRVEHPDTPNFQSWVWDPRTHRGVFRCSDGEWTHHWAPLPSFIFGVSAGDELERTEGVVPPRQASDRIGFNAEDMVVMNHYAPLMAEAVARFPADGWTRIAAEVGVPVQKVRSPEEALLDEDLVRDGCVTETLHPVHGPVRSVGQVYRLHSCPSELGVAAPVRGEHTDEVREQARAAAVTRAARPLAAPSAGGLRHPLEGILVVDMGLAVAGPWGGSMLASLGADVVKVNAPADAFWMSTQMGMMSNRGKRSLSVDLKTPEGQEIIQALLQRCDVVTHNMRYDAAQKLSVDYDTVRAYNPRVVYCHSIGHERGPRERCPGNDQTGSALGGTSWVEGAADSGNEPHWPGISLGDTGNGLLAAIAVTQALYHRDRTGQGQFVDTSILYAHLLNNSANWIAPDGSARAPRPQLDNELLGLGPLYRLYETEDGSWLCLAVITADEWRALCAAMEAHDPGLGERFPTAEVRATERDALTQSLADTFRRWPGAQWLAELDAHKVPCEIADPDFIGRCFDDPEMLERGWVVESWHRVVGRMTAVGNLIDLSETPQKKWGAPLVPGDHTPQILAELGYDDATIERLVKDAVVKVAPPATANRSADNGGNHGT